MMYMSKTNTKITEILGLLNGEIEIPEPLIPNSGVFSLLDLLCMTNEKLVKMTTSIAKNPEMSIYNIKDVHNCENKVRKILHQLVAYGTVMYEIYYKEELDKLGLQGARHNTRKIKKLS